MTRLSKVPAALGITLLFLLGAAPAPRPAEDARAWPEQDLLKRDEGVWNATVQMIPEPGADPEVSNGVETNLLATGGRWLINDFKGRLNDQAFQGHGMLGYDPARKKFVRAWVDTTQSTLWTAIGTYDLATRTLTMWMETPDPSGQPLRFRTTTTWKDNDTKVYTMYAPGPETTEAAGMIITYRRRK